MFVFQPHELLKYGRLALGPLFHQLCSAGCGLKSATEGPSMLTRIRHSNTSTDKQDLQSDLSSP